MKGVWFFATTVPVSKLVIIYVLFGLKKAKELGHIPPAVEILNYLEKVEELKRCESEEKLPKLITEVRATVTQVPSHFHKSKEVSAFVESECFISAERIIILYFSTITVIFKQNYWYRFGKLFCLIWTLKNCYRFCRCCTSTDFSKQTP